MFGVGSCCGIDIQRADSSLCVDAESQAIVNGSVANGDQHRMFTLSGHETASRQDAGSDGPHADWMGGEDRQSWRSHGEILSGALVTPDVIPPRTPRASSAHEIPVEAVKILLETGARGPSFRHDQRPHTPLMTNLGLVSKLSNDKTEA
jgi:hypothetical protein